MGLVQISVEIQELIKGLNDLEKRQLPFALMTGLNLTVDDVKAATQHEMRDSFDRPTPYTLKGIRIKRATKTESYADASLQDQGGKNRPSQYLQPEIKGGPRGLKGYERLLGDRYTVPGNDIRRDVYGNIPGGLITRLLSDSGLLRGGAALRSWQDQMAAAERAKKNRTRRTSRGEGVYFIGAPGGGRYPAGVWERRRVGQYRVIRPVLLFLDHSPNYEPRLEWGFTARLIWKRNFKVNFQQGLAYALATARK